jgi:adenine-specific DNA methylase
LGLIINKNNDGNEVTLSKYKTVERCFFSLNGFGMKPPGVNPGIKAFIYNTYCLPKCTYGMGIFNLKKKTIKSINVSQNNLFRYALNIPYKTHITLIMKALKILDATTLYYSQICVLKKLLHRHEFTKKLLMG